MDVSARSENRRHKRALLDCKAAGPVGHVVGTQLEGRGLPAEVFLRQCSRRGEELTQVAVDRETFETFGQSIDYYWGRDARSVVVQHSTLVHLDREVDDPIGLDVAPLIRDFARPERIRLGERDTVFLRAGGSVLLRDAGVLYSESNHPFGWLRGADVATFEPLSVRYAKDEGRVWYLDQRVEGADPATFEVLAAHLGRDRRSVFYAAAKIPGADRDSFRVSSHRTGKDRRAAYRIELNEAGWVLFCDDSVCHQHRRERTLPGQQILWSDYDRYIFR